MINYEGRGYQRIQLEDKQSQKNEIKIVEYKNWTPKRIVYDIAYI